MFPARPDGCIVPEMEDNNQLLSPGSIMEEQIWRHLTRLHPYKAPGADGIPNIVLKKSAELIVPYLLQIFRVALGLQMYASQWRDITTCVLRKPGKPRYDVPKAYQPTALVNTIAKLLSSIVTEDMTYLAETHCLLPNTHFGGWPGWSTTDSLHLLADTVKVAWWCKQVVVACSWISRELFPMQSLNGCYTTFEHTASQKFMSLL